MTSRRLLLLLVCLATTAYAQSPGWSGWRGPDGTGVSKETGWNPLALQGGARVLWSADVGAGYSNVAIRDGRLYATGRDPKDLTFIVTCLDAATGKVIWKNEKLRSTGDPEATPAVDGTYVYGLGNDGLLFCLKAENGKVVWQKSLQKDFGIADQAYGWAGSPVIEGDLLILNAGSTGLALRTRDGKRAWPVGPSTGGVPYCASPVIVGPAETRVALLAGPIWLNAVDVATGKVRWSYEHKVGPEVVADPVPFGASVLFSQIARTVLLDVKGGMAVPAWTSWDFCASLTAPVLVEGNLYGQHASTSVGVWDWAAMQRATWPLMCLDPATGRKRWEAPMHPVNVTAAGGRLLLLGLDGTLRIAEASPEAYRELASADVLAGAKRPRLFATPPVLLDGRIYCRNYAGDLVCIDVSR